MSVKPLERAENLSSLKKRWAAFFLTGSLFLAGAFYWLHASWGQAESLRWLLLSTLLFSYLCLSLWRSLAYNYRVGETRLLPSLGVGNQLTLLRGLLVALLAGFLLAPRPNGALGWLPGLLMTAVAVADLFDGYLARRTNHATRLGEILDMQLDGLSLLLSTSLAVIYRQAPAWFILVGLARFLFLAMVALLRRLGKPVIDLPPSASRRPFAGAMMGFSAVLLFPLFSPPATHLAAVLFSLPFLAGFIRDGFAVSGIPSPRSLSLEVSPERNVLLRWVPVALRVLLAAGLVLKLAGLSTSFPGPMAGSSAPISGLIFGLLLVAVVLLAAGAAGRVGAICALFALGLLARSYPLDGLDLSLIIAATALFFLGSGELSTWRPEDRLIEKRLGEKIG